MNRTYALYIAGPVVLALASGCAAPADAPDVDVDVDVDAQQIVYSTNADGTWSANAAQPTQLPELEMYASGTFAGPAGKTRKMGVCALRLSTTSCSTVANCGSVPSSLPTGGARYCTAPNGGSSKVCAWRPGTATAYCAGSPAGGGVAVSPGTFATDLFSAGFHQKWISYACFEGCAATDPSSSSAAISSYQCTTGPGGICI